MQAVSFSGTLRDHSGKKYNRQLRNEGRIPAVLYGKGLNKPFSLNPKDVKHLVYTPDFKLAELTLEGETYSCFLKDIQFHPVTDEIVHIDFLSLTDGVPVNVQVPIRTVGVSPGVKTGGSLIKMLRKVDINTVPENIIDHVTVDISSLELGDSIRVRDIELNEGITILNDPATPVALVEVPRALKSAKAAADGEQGADAESDEDAAE